jgi:hypothetical protein
MLIEEDFKFAANAYSLDVKLLKAMSEVESGKNPNRWRTEADYRYLWDCKHEKPFRKLTDAEKNNEKAPADFTAEVGSRNTEWIGQQASWGPLQIMGGVARELGFKGDFTELCGPEGLLYGAKHLRNLYKRFFESHGLNGVIAAYNAGSPRLVGGKFENQVYVDKVHKAMGA